MSAANVDLIRGIYEGFNRGDLPAVLDALDPEIEWIEPYPVGHNPGTHVGPDAVVQNVFVPAMQEWDNFVVQPLEFLDAGHRVVVTGVITGRNKATGKDLHAPVCWVWTVRDGKAIRNANYQDTALWLIAQSMDPAPDAVPV